MKSSIIDSPRKGGQIDQLGIEAYKNGLTSFISTAQTPLTIAIQGEWGSGKTSLMNYIKHDLCDQQKSFHSVWINTWEYSLLTDEQTSMTNIIQGIILSVIKVLEQDKNQNIENLKKKAIGFFKTAVKNVAKTGANMATGGIAGDATDNLFISDVNESSLKDLHSELQTQINNCITKDKTKGFLFFIDDLDRINPPVAVKILELLKNIFDLENCIFLLAIDYDVVVKGLEPKFGIKTQSNEREFRSFFEKIIQLPFTMPVGQYKVNNLIIDGLKDVSYFDNEITKEVEKDIVSIASLTVGSNPRSIKRLLNSLSLVKSITKSVNNDDFNLNLLEELINICVFSIQISYPLIYKTLEKFPNFNEWGENIIEEYKLEKLDEEIKSKIEKNDFFDEDWEQVLYQLCQTDKFLCNRAIKISKLLNLTLDIINKNVKEHGDNLDHVSVEDVMKNAIQVSAVTSYSENDVEQKVEEVHKSGFLKSLKNKIHTSLIAKCEENDIQISYTQKRIQSNLTYIIKKENHHYRLDISLISDSKENYLNAQTGSWYYIKAPHKSFNLNLNEELAVSINARERYEKTINNIKELELTSGYLFNDWVSRNDNHNTVMFRMYNKTENVWEFIENSDSVNGYVDNLVNFLVATKDIKIVDVE
jgi:hypothetical protein